MLRVVLNRLFSLVFIGLFAAAGLAQNRGYDELQGRWQVVEIVDNGRVIPKEAIPSWLPSGGRIEFIDNTIVFSSPETGQRHARTFLIDASSYPKKFNLIDGGQMQGQGIYQFDSGRLVVCLSPAGVPVPNGFSAPAGSNCAMMVLERVDVRPEGASTVTTVASSAPSNAPIVVQQPVVKQQPVVVTQPVVVRQEPIVVQQPVVVSSPVTTTVSSGTLNDAEVARLLPGTWRIQDTYGSLFLSIANTGTYSTYRESIQTSTFQQVMGRVPVSSGTWTLRAGTVYFNCMTSTSPERVHKNFPFNIRSVNTNEFVYTDYANNTGTAVRVN